MAGALWDFRYAWRMLRGSPAFTLAAVLSLALGIGANTAIFNLIDTVLLRMLPVRHPEELVLVHWSAEEPPRQMTSLMGYWSKDKLGRYTSTAFSYPAFRWFQEHNDGFSDLVAFSDAGSWSVVARQQADMAEGEFVSGNYYSMLGVRAALGRTLQPADDQPGAPPVAVMSFRYWQGRLGADPSLVGRTIRINGAPFTLAGISAPEFFGLEPGRSPDIWVPFSAQALVAPRRNDLKDPSTWWVVVAGRLKPGGQPQQARAGLDVVFQQQLASAPPATHDARRIPRIDLTPAGKGLDTLRHRFSKPLFVLMAVVGLLLLIACANVANLLLARATTRRREVAVRLALGADRARLIRQFLAESILLALLGGGIGLLFSRWGTRALLGLVSSGPQPLSLRLHSDLSVLGFTAAVSLLTGIVFGLAPAFRATRVDLTPALKSVSPTPGAAHFGLGLIRSLVIFQVALSVLLLVGAGLFLRTLRNLEQVDAGFQRENVLLFRVNPVQAGYDEDRIAPLYRQLEERLAAVPGVRSVGMSAFTLLSDARWMPSVAFRGSVSAPAKVVAVPVGPGFFETMGIPLLQGRTISQSDEADAPKVAVVNQAFVRELMQNQDPIGVRFDCGSRRDVQIVGVAKDARYSNLREPAPPTVYLSYVQIGAGPMTFELRTALDPRSLVGAVRQVVQSVDRNLPISDVKTQAQQADESLYQERLIARLAGFFSALALLLACVGLYGVMAYSVARRRREIAIRVALGARRPDILGMILRQTLRLVLTGLAIGIPAALAAAGLLSAMLYGLSGIDWPTLAATAAIMTAIALIAGYLPARHAAGIDPMAGLRDE